MRALDGIRVLDFTWVLAGPILTRALAFHGAEVIRVETSKRLDPVVPFSPNYGETHAGKKSIGLNVGHPEGRKLFNRLLEVSDVVVDNYAAGVMERLGLGYEKLREVNPRIIQLTMPALGSSGPHKDDVTFGPNLHALSGLDHLTGYPEEIPGGVGMAYADYAAPGHAFVALMAALWDRDITGEGQWIDLSQFEALVSVMGPELLATIVNGEDPIRQGNFSQYKAPYNCYPCRGEDKWCAIAVSTDDEWARLCQAMGNPGLAQDTRFDTVLARLKNRAELDGIISKWTARQTSYEVMMTLQRAGVAASMVQDMPEVCKDPHLAAREFLQTDIPDHWHGKVNLGGIQVRLSSTPGWVKDAAPYMGEQNGLVFGELLGMAPEEIETLKAKGAIEEMKPEAYPYPSNYPARPKTKG